ncbi:DUF2243 domain-containing protein [Halocatena pleomorpha]|uniref:DUF2243 domain-containing protein n=1 Tax=Halocatena pleomorpha TaxID=1785090 RepID=A0A3P3REY5_9EURY|nr:DUF2243 domain-containing protein [Halocatena pleomorpha]RRJ32057.1 DUF2243 domain-containing protein [Halocatena pleomorpha]
MSDHETWLGLQKPAKPLVRAGIFLGIGLGGFFDGIVVHQILQWHHMLSAVTDTTIISVLRLNVMVDGFFHVVTYVFTILGIILLWRAWQQHDVPASGRALFGSVILGWGVFNVVEGIIDHHLLGIHHVWPAGPGSVLLWDAAFLVWGVLFIIGGYAIVRRAVSPASGRDREQSARGEQEREEIG